ncbi:multidrug effflux MFS transporter [Acinetobacter terrestris]|uniref:multidrug effflux MFS transporter n=1 Tax=Acinetobacter terrestris TaxID=2529843 RepID=UPI00103EC33B|nr:multidrug effflux MFS transporter [Acinetobacter terrestris]TCB57242.1 Bcr/CflA family efflux MFS transporter [Acinetobacter terrestris]
MTSSTNRTTPLLIAALSTIGPLGIDMYLPSIPAMAASLNCTEGAIQLSLMTFFLGLMFGQLFYGPLSDKFGRKPMIYLGLSIFVLGSIGCVFAESVMQLHFLRLIQGLGGSIGMVITFAIIKDLYQGPMMGKMMSMVLAILGLSPVLAPLIGNGLQHLESWRAIFLFLAVYAAIVFIACANLLPETRSKEHSASFKLSKTFHHYFKIYFDRKFIVYALTLCIAQAGFFAYLAGSASVFITEYKLTATQFSVLFAINALGLVAAAIFNPRLHQKFGALKTYRLVNTAYFIVIGLLFSLLCMGYHNLYIVCAGLFIAVTLLGFIMPTGSQLALMHQHEHTGTASALLGSMQFGTGAIVSAITGALAAWGGLGLILVIFVCALVSALMCNTLFEKQDADLQQPSFK